MAEIKPEQKHAKKSAKCTGKSFKGFTDEERSAMRERVQELRVETRVDRETVVLANTAAMPNRIAQ